jgi:hypothetical protein
MSNSIKPAIIQLTPPAMGPNRTPVRGVKTHPSRKKAPFTPKTGVSGRALASTLRAAKTDIKERRRLLGGLLLFVKAVTFSSRGS